MDREGISPYWAKIDLYDALKWMNALSAICKLFCSQNGFNGFIWQFNKNMVLGSVLKGWELGHKVRDNWKIELED